MRLSENSAVLLLFLSSAVLNVAFCQYQRRGGRRFQPPNLEPLNNEERTHQSRHLDDQLVPVWSSSSSSENVDDAAARSSALRSSVTVPESSNDGFKQLDRRKLIPHLDLESNLSYDVPFKASQSKSNRATNFPSRYQNQNDGAGRSGRTLPPPAPPAPTSLPNRRSFNERVVENASSLSQTDARFSRKGNKKLGQQSPEAESQPRATTENNPVARQRSSKSKSSQKEDPPSSRSHRPRGEPAAYLGDLNVGVGKGDGGSIEDSDNYPDVYKQLRSQGNSAAEIQEKLRLEKAKKIKTETRHLKSGTNSPSYQSSRETEAPKENLKFTKLLNDQPYRIPAEGNPIEYQTPEESLPPFKSQKQSSSLVENKFNLLKSPPFRGSVTGRFRPEPNLKAPSTQVSTEALSEPTVKNVIDANNFNPYRSRESSLLASRDSTRRNPTTPDKKSIRSRGRLTFSQSQEGKQIADSAEKTSTDPVIGRGSQSSFKPRQKPEPSSELDKEQKTGFQRGRESKFLRNSPSKTIETESLKEGDNSSPRTTPDNKSYRKPFRNSSRFTNEKENVDPTTDETSKPSRVRDVAVNKSPIGARENQGKKYTDAARTGPEIKMPSKNYLKNVLSQQTREAPKTVPGSRKKEAFQPLTDNPLIPLEEYYDAEYDDSRFSSKSPEVTPTNADKDPFLQTLKKLNGGVESTTEGATSFVPRGKVLGYKTNRKPTPSSRFPPKRSFSDKVEELNSDVEKTTPKATFKPKKQSVIQNIKYSKTRTGVTNIVDDDALDFSSPDGFSFSGSERKEVSLESAEKDTAGTKDTVPSGISEGGRIQDAGSEKGDSNKDKTNLKKRDENSSEINNDVESNPSTLTSPTKLTSVSTTTKKPLTSTTVQTTKPIGKTTPKPIAKTTPKPIPKVTLKTAKPTSKPLAKTITKPTTKASMITNKPTNVTVQTTQAPTTKTKIVPLTTPTSPTYIYSSTPKPTKSIVNIDDVFGKSINRSLEILESTNTIKQRDTVSEEGTKQNLTMEAHKEVETVTMATMTSTLSTTSIVSTTSTSSTPETTPKATTTVPTTIDFWKPPSKPDVPFYIYGLYPNGTVVRRFPNGTVVPDEMDASDKVEQLAKQGDARDKAVFRQIIDRVMYMKSYSLQSANSELSRPNGLLPTNSSASSISETTSTTPMTTISTTTPLTTSTVMTSPVTVQTTTTRPPTTTTLSSTKTPPIKSTSVKPTPKTTVKSTAKPTTKKPTPKATTKPATSKPQTTTTVGTTTTTKATTPLPKKVTTPTLLSSTTTSTPVTASAPEKRSPAPESPSTSATTPSTTPSMTTISSTTSPIPTTTPTTKAPSTTSVKPAAPSPSTSKKTIPNKPTAKTDIPKTTVSKTTPKPLQKTTSGATMTTNVKTTQTPSQKASTVFIVTPTPIAEAAKIFSTLNVSNTTPTPKLATAEKSSVKTTPILSVTTTFTTEPNDIMLVSLFKNIGSFESEKKVNATKSTNNNSVVIPKKGIEPKPVNNSLSDQTVEETSDIKTAKVQPNQNTSTLSPESASMLESMVKLGAKSQIVMDMIAMANATGQLDTDPSVLANKIIELAIEKAKTMQQITPIPPDPLLESNRLGKSLEDSMKVEGMVADKGSEGTNNSTLNLLLNNDDIAKLSQAEILNAILSSPDILGPNANQITNFDDKTTKKPKKKKPTTTTTSPLRFLGLLNRLRNPQGETSSINNGDYDENDQQPPNNNDLSDFGNEDGGYNRQPNDGLLGAVVDVTRAMSRLMATVVQGATRSLRSFLRQRTRNLANFLTQGSAG